MSPACPGANEARAGAADLHEIDAALRAAIAGTASRDSAGDTVGASAARAAATSLIRRLICLPSCASTQDEARARCGSEPGLLVVAGVQTAGRGRLGRAWSEGQGMGLAATFVLPGPRRLAPARLALGVGLAACRTCEAALEGGGAEAPAFADGARASGRSAMVGLRWPNDVVLRSDPRIKLSGVLIETTPELAFVGVGINVLQQRTDFLAELQSRAVSLSMLGSRWTRAAVAVRLLAELTGALALEEPQLAGEWLARDVLRDRVVVVRSGEVTQRGVVRSIDPTHEIVLEVQGGAHVRMPAATATLLEVGE